MNKAEIKIGELVQLNPELTKNQIFAGCIMVVTDPKSWGAQGYIQSFGENGKHGSRVFYRASWEEMEIGLSQSLLTGTQSSLRLRSQLTNNNSVFRANNPTAQAGGCKNKVQGGVKRDASIYRLFLLRRRSH